MRTLVCIALVMLLLPLTAYAQPPLPTYTSAAHCLDAATEINVVSGPLAARLRPTLATLQHGEAFDLRAATASIPLADGNWSPIVIDAWEISDLCVSGGTVWGNHSLSSSWIEVHATNHYAEMSRSVGGIVEGLAAHNVLDGVRLNGGLGAFTVRDSWLSYIRDDCIENDTLRSGTIERTLFDGCYMGLSTTPGSSQLATADGSAETVVLRDSLMRLEPMPRPYDLNESQTPGAYLSVPGYTVEFGHSAIWKHFGSRDVNYELRGHNIFYLEGGRTTNSPAGYDFHPKIAVCEDVTIIWLGDGRRYGRPLATDYPGALPTNCRTLTIVTDPLVGRDLWEQAVNAWFVAHPSVGLAPSNSCEAYARPLPGGYRVPHWPRFAP